MLRRTQGNLECCPRSKTHKEVLPWAPLKLKSASFSKNAIQGTEDYTTDQRQYFQDTHCSSRTHIHRIRKKNLAINKEMTHENEQVNSLNLSLSVTFYVKKIGWVGAG